MRILFFSTLLSLPVFASGQACDFCPGNSHPPSSTVRAMAEWEELQAIAVTFTQYKAELSQIICEAKKEVLVYVISSNPATDSVFIKDYCSDLSNIIFKTAPNFFFNTVWIRDYGPNSVYKNDVDSLLFIDWIYDRAARPNDNCIPGMLGLDLNVPVFITRDTSASPPNDLTNAGGNFIANGLGTAFASSLIRETNSPDSAALFCGLPDDQAAIDFTMNQFLGIDNYIVLQKLPFDIIHHVDMSMKLLDEETLLFGQFPEEGGDGSTMEANINFLLDNFKTPFGNDYKIVRIPMPPCENGNYPPHCETIYEYPTYTNAHIINRSILVPTYNIPMDSTALRIWAEAMPGYRIVGIDAREISKGTGAIHCVTKEIGVFDPLWIVHEKTKEACAGAEVEIVATIKHRSGIAQAKVYYAAEPQNEFDSIDMVEIAPDTFKTVIPTMDVGTVVHYYIQATAISGKKINRPMPAPDAFWTFEFGNCLVATTSKQTASPTRLGFIFPNPASGTAAIPIENDKTRKANIRVTDTLGKLVELVFDGILPAGKSTFRIETKTYNPGTYFIFLKSESNVQVRKLVVQSN